MNRAARHVQRVYLTLLFGNSLASSLIWGINTLFLLDGGLSNTEAFSANAFFTLGMVIFEIPTGAVADLIGRKASYALGTITLAVATGLYWWLWKLHAPFGWWALVSILLGLGFTFFSGAVDAWLVDALTAVQFTGRLEAVFGRGLVVTGVGTLAGSVGGGVIAQLTNLGVPFLLRAVILVVMFVIALLVMRDIGFTPNRSTGPVGAIRQVFAASIEHGIRKPAVRYLVLAAPFVTGVSLYAFYALQPYLLELFGSSTAYSVAGLTAAILALSQILGGVLAPRIRALFVKRTTVIIAATVGSALALIVIGTTSLFWVAVVFIVLWGFVAAAAGPVRQTYLNGLIPSTQRATILSFDSLSGSLGGVVFQPALGRAADLYGYGTSLVIGGAIQLVSIPFLLASRHRNDPADTEAPRR